MGGSLQSISALQFNFHINVEICSYIKIVKHIYKYIWKGYNKSSFHLHTNNTYIEIDEIKEYQ